MAEQAPMERFAALAAKWSCSFDKRIDTLLAFRAEGVWQLGYGMTVFTGEPFAAVPVDVRTPTIRALRRVQALDASEARQVVAEVLASPMQMNVGTELVEIAPGYSEGDHRAYMHLVRPPRFHVPTTRLPTLEIRPTQPELHPHLGDAQSLDLELFSCEAPFSGLQDLLLELEIPVGADAIMHERVREIMITPPARIEPASSLEDGKVDIRVIARGGLDRAGLRVGLRGYSSTGRAVRQSVSGAAMEWQQQGALQLGRHEYELPDCPLVLGLLSYDGDFLGQWYIQDAARSFNPLLQVHRSLDQDDAFRKTFFDGRQGEFEDRITLLLTLSGLTTLKHGGIGVLTDAPDILALSRSGHLYVVECTTGDVNQKGKLHRLHNRAKRIREHLQSAGASIVAVQPMVATSLSRAETLAHSDTARIFGIALVCREDLEALLNRVEMPVGDEQLYQAALSCIPQGAPDGGPVSGA